MYHSPPIPIMTNGLMWTDTGSRIMAAILFLITYQNIQKWLKYIKYVPLIIFYPILIESRQEGARYLKIQIRDCSLFQM